MKIHITIEPGKFTGAVIEWIGKHRRTSAVFMVLLSFVALWAAPITKPHTFSNGGIVSASEMNANFDALYTKVNALDSTANTIRFPDGDTGTPVLNTSGAYVVPAGKTLFIMAAASIVYRGGSNAICVSTQYGCMVEAGSSLTTSNAISGFLVDTVTAPLNNNSGSYTVPAGKTAIILSTPTNISVGSTVVQTQNPGLVGFYPAGTTLTWSGGSWITGYLK